MALNLPNFRQPALSVCILGSFKVCSLKKQPNSLKQHHQIQFEPQIFSVEIPFAQFWFNPYFIQIGLNQFRILDLSEFGAWPLKKKNCWNKNLLDHGLFTLPNVFCVLQMLAVGLVMIICQVTMWQSITRGVPLLLTLGSRSSRIRWDIKQDFPWRERLFVVALSPFSAFSFQLSFHVFLAGRPVSRNYLLYWLFGKYSKINFGQRVG